MSKPSARRRAWLIAGASCTPLLAAAPALSQEDVASQLKALRALVDAQAHELETQRKSLEAQGRQLHDQAAEIQTLKAQGSEPSEALVTFRGRGLDPQTLSAGSSDPQAAPAPPPQRDQPASAGSPPPQPVGQAPPPPAPSQAAAATVTQALPEFMGVLMGPGHWVVEPQFEFSHSSTNELVFRGVEIVPGLQVGLIDATTANRNTVSTALDVRTGLTNRLELEVRAPFVYRHDQTTTLEQRSSSSTITETVSNSDIGDVEVVARYQLNSARNDTAIWIGSVDVKTNTGLGPFDVTFDKFGVAQQEATGSGFWSIEPSVNLLYPSDPVVLFASVGYVASIGRTFNKLISPNIKLQKVSPGGSPVGALGFAFALNDRFSFSLGYKHSYIRPTTTEVNGVRSDSLPLQVGVSTFSMSYRITPTINVSDNFEFGVTRDAPDVHVLTRLSFFF